MCGVWAHRVPGSTAIYTALSDPTPLFLSPPLWCRCAFALPGNTLPTSPPSTHAHRDHSRCAIPHTHAPQSIASQRVRFTAANVLLPMNFSALPPVGAPVKPAGRALESSVGQGVGKVGLGPMP